MIDGLPPLRRGVAELEPGDRIADCPEGPWSVVHVVADAGDGGPYDVLLEDPDGHRQWLEGDPWPGDRVVWVQPAVDPRPPWLVDALESSGAEF